MIDPREAERATSSRRGRSTTMHHASIDCICRRRTPRSQSIKLNPTSVSIAEPTMDASMRRIHDAIESMRGGRSSAPIIKSEDFDALRRCIPEEVCHFCCTQTISKVSRSTSCLHEALRLLCNYDHRPTRGRTRDFESKGTKHHDAACEYRSYPSSAHTSLPIDQAQSDLGVDRRTNHGCLDEAHTRCN